MSRDAAQFDEGLGAQVIRPTPAPAPAAPPLDKGGQGGFAPDPLSADDLATLLCRIPYTNLATGERGEIVLSAADWQALLDRHHLAIRRVTR